jgi:heme-degrading monooxygenase HmoA
MFAVIFEVSPRPERWDAYLGYAKMLRPELEQIDGFVENERFSSLRRKGWLLSLSIWQDEKAVIRWRTHARHHDVQKKGRTEVFADYHLRVGEIVADSRPPAGQVLREQRFDETAAAAKLIVMAEAAVQGLPAEQGARAIAERLGMPHTADGGLVDWDVFESIVQPGKFILLTSWREMTAAAGLSESVGARHRRVRVIRDYGMFDRAEAPQYYPPVPTVDGPG